MNIADVIKDITENDRSLFTVVTRSQMDEQCSNCKYNWKFVKIEHSEKEHCYMFRDYFHNCEKKRII